MSSGVDPHSPAPNIKLEETRDLPWKSMTIGAEGHIQEVKAETSAGPSQPDPMQETAEQRQPDPAPGNDSIQEAAGEAVAGSSQPDQIQETTEQHQSAPAPSGADVRTRSEEILIQLLTAEFASRETTAQPPTTPHDDIPTEGSTDGAADDESLPGDGSEELSVVPNSDRKRSRSQSPEDVESTPSKRPRLETTAQDDAPIEGCMDEAGDSDALPDYTDEEPDVTPGPDFAPEPGVAPNQTTKRPRSKSPEDESNTSKRARLEVPAASTQAKVSSSGAAAQGSKRPRARANKRPRPPPPVSPPPPPPAPPQQAAAPLQAPVQPAPHVWDDQISPKTVPPLRQAAPAPAPEQPIATTAAGKKTRKPKPPPANKPSTTNLTWSTVEPLLPSSTFGSGAWIHRRRYWTVKDELELRRSWSAADEAAVVPSEAEVLVSRHLAALYSGTPRVQDLFRYGLKYISPQPHRNGTASDQRFWVRLLRLLPHPFFMGRLEVLRYALQQAVWFRTSSLQAGDYHVQPFAPPWSHAEPGYVAHLKELQSRYPAGSTGWLIKAKELVETAEFRARTQVVGRVGMQELVGVMAEERARFYPRWPAVPELEKYLFLLEERDVNFLEVCLDRLDAVQRETQARKALNWEEQNFGVSYGEIPCGEIPYVEEHRGHRAGLEFVMDPAAAVREKNCAIEPITVDGTFARFFRGLGKEETFVTADMKAAYLVEKRMGVLADRREAVIRQRISAKGGRETSMLLDVPPFDPNPDFHLFQGDTGAVELGGLYVVMGVYTTPDISDWLYRQGMGQKEKKPGAAPDSAVARVLGSGADAVVENRGQVEDVGGGGRFRAVNAPPPAPAQAPGDQQGGEQEAGAASEAAEEDDAAPSNSVVKQFAVYRGTGVQGPPPLMVMGGGGLWARRKGREAEQ